MLEIVALGGLGEFGMNMLALSWAETTIVVDAGVMFPDPELLGVDRIIPDLTYLQQRRVAALILTHGHEDHIGAVPHVLAVVDGPIYGTPLTLALVEPKLQEHGIEGRQLVAVRPRERFGSVVRPPLECLEGAAASSDLFFRMDDEVRGAAQSSGGQGGNRDSCRT